MRPSQQPIGIFDSGVGGLTVAHAVTQLLPHENIVYFGDTAHLPYGDKSTAAIQAYAVKICDCLLQQHCKVILIACNSASAAAFDLVKEYVGSRAIVLDVIDPIVEYVSQHYQSAQIGLLGTRQTVNSNIYKKKLDELNPNITLHSLATPLLTPMIEEGYCKNKIITSVIADYLRDPVLANIDALILACTHYPLIKEPISQFYHHKIDIIDSSQLTALALKALLTTHQLTNSQKTTGTKLFYVSDYTESFTQSARLFFQEEIGLAHYPLWE